MTPYERVMNRLQGKAVDKIPNMNIVMAFAAKQIGATLKDFVLDYRVLVESKLHCVEHYGIDVVSAISDPMREAHGFGAKVIFPENDNPYCKEHLLNDLSDIGKLKPVNPMANERMLDRVRAIEMFKSQVKGQVPIIGWVEGALAEAADLRDISLVMMDLMMEPDRIKELFEVIYEQQALFAKAQIDAGADFIGVGNAAASLVGPKLYEEFCLAYDRRIIKYIHDNGAKAKLHICGNTEPILHLLAQTDADIFDVDHVVDFGKVVKAFKGTRTVANGNLDPVSEILNGSSSSLSKSIEARLKVADERSLISGGCEIPLDTPVENMTRMNELLYVQ